MALMTYTVEQFRQLILARKGVEEPTLDTSDAGDAYVDANAIAHLAALLQLDVQDVYNALFPQHAVASDLDEHGRVWLGTGRIAATIWSGRVELTKTAAGALTVPAGLQMIAGDGIIYKTQEAASSWGTDDTCVVKADSVNKGTQCNKPAGTVLTVQSPPAGLSGTATINATTTEAVDDEDDEHLRTRILLATCYRPGGGSPADYASWALEAHKDVAAAYVYPRWNDNGTKGTVTVAIVGQDPYVLLSDAIRAAVAAYVETKRPVGATVDVVLPNPLEQLVTIQVRPKTGYGPDWSGDLTVQAGSTTDTVIYTGAPTGMAIGDRIVCCVNAANPYYEQRVIRWISNPPGTLTVSPPFSGVPVSLSIARAGGPLWQGIFDAIKAVFEGLGCSSSTDATKPRFPAEADGKPSTLYLSDLYHAVEGVTGVLSCTVTNPAGDVTNSVSPGANPDIRGTHGMTTISWT